MTISNLINVLKVSLCLYLLSPIKLSYNFHIAPICISVLFYCTFSLSLFHIFIFSQLALLLVPCYFLLFTFAMNFFPTFSLVFFFFLVPFCFVYPFFYFLAYSPFSSFFLSLYSCTFYLLCFPFNPLPFCVVAI